MDFAVAIQFEWRANVLYIGGEVTRKAARVCIIVAVTVRSNEGLSQLPHFSLRLLENAFRRCVVPETRTSPKQGRTAPRCPGANKYVSTCLTLCPYS